MGGRDREAEDGGRNYEKSWESYVCIHYNVPVGRSEDESASQSNDDDVCKDWCRKKWVKKEQVGRKRAGTMRMTKTNRAHRRK